MARMHPNGTGCQGIVLAMRKVRTALGNCLPIMYTYFRFPGNDIVPNEVFLPPQYAKLLILVSGC
ncbi:hypothetical protein T01_7160 [Trichinella spiralis]|uniref:Uncharacterized protein n=1 Tax=Trichinella spiralis TaxID=6334 RepID=A0A0V1BIX0_TRISP|nr:hypothetical protein T01_7160 [Trichinella spiralis]